MPVMTTGPAQIWVTGTGTNSAVWQGWNQDHGYIVNTTSTTVNGVWQDWNQVWTSVGTTTSTWMQWNVTYTPAPAETEEVLAQRRREQQEAADRCREQMEEARRNAEAASAHAEELLLALLSDQQAGTWREHRYFEVRGSRSGRTYRIRRGTLSNVDLMAEDADQAEMHYCAHPPDVPVEDANLAQMFLLTTDEDAFLRVANAHVAHPRRHLRPVPDEAAEVREVLTERPDLHAVA